MHPPARTHAHKIDPAPRRAAAWAYASPAKTGRFQAALAAAGVRAKMEVSSPEDACEREADRLADRIVSIPDSALGAGGIGALADSPPSARAAAPGLAAIRRAIEPWEEAEPETDTMIRTAAEPGGPAPAVPAGLGRDIEGLSRGGQPLSPAVRRYFEPRFGQDFSSVRIHTGAAPAQASAAIGARAFTVGDHISFARGAYQPGTSSGKRLLAHELSHVVQQRDRPQAVIQRAEDDEGGGLLDSLTDPMSLVREYAPELAPLLEQGPFEYLKTQLSSAFDSLAERVTGMLPPGAAEQLGAAFGPLLDQASAILEGLASGDCQPLLDAIGQLTGLLSQVAGEAWDGLTAVLQPIGDFFQDLWDSTGAPAVEWLSSFAGEVWNDITELGQQIWDWTQPIRDIATAAWEWVKEQLFGSESGSIEDGSGGIVGFVTAKATEAWESIKEQARPVWEPVAQAVELIRSVVPPDFIKSLGEQLQGLGASINEAGASIGTEGDKVAENREALAGALPSVQQILAAARQGIVSARDFVLGAISGLSGLFTGILTQLRATGLLGGLADALSWLEGMGTDLSAWAQTTLGGVYDGLLAAFDFVSPFLEKILGVVRQVITVVTDLVQLPSLVMGELWGLIPECVREPIKDFLLNEILARIPVFNSLLALPDLWAKVEAVALEILTQVFVDGDLVGAAWTYFRNMLALIGIPPDLVVRILAKAATAIGDILTDPIGFLINLVGAAQQGFVQFFENIGTHLSNGVVDWLFGRLGEAGISMPEDLSLGSILKLVFEILGVTEERLFEKLGERVGPEVVARLRGALELATGVWSWVSILINEGPAGLWREIKDQISGLWGAVLDSVMGWISGVVIMQGTLWLASLIDISGISQIITTLVAIYRAIESAIVYMVDMLNIVDRFLDGVVGIATGDVTIAAAYLEDALARSLPVAIGFTAYQLGIGNIASKIQEMVEAVRGIIDKALDWLIDRAVKGGAALIETLKSGVAAIRDWWTARKEIKTESGEEHTLYFTGSGASATLTIQSEPQPFAEFIRSLSLPAEKEPQRKAAIDVATELDKVAHSAAPSKSKGGAAAATSPASGEVDPGVRIVELLNQLALLVAPLIPASSSKPSTDPVYGSPHNGTFGKSVRVERLGPDHDPGGKPSVEAPIWDILDGRRTSSDKGPFYVKGHLLNEQLGGPGNTWDNLTPLSRSGNATHFQRFEKDIKVIVNGKGSDFNASEAKQAQEDGKTSAVSFIVTANYGGRTFDDDFAAVTDQAKLTARQQDIAKIQAVEKVHVPTSLDCTATVVQPGANSNPKRTVGEVLGHVQLDNHVPTEEEDYTLAKAPK